MINFTIVSKIHTLNGVVFCIKFLYITLSFVILFCNNSVEVKSTGRLATIGYVLRESFFEKFNFFGIVRFYITFDDPTIYSCRVTHRLISAISHQVSMTFLRDKVIQ